MFKSIPIKVFGKIVGWSTEPTQQEIEDWDNFEADFKYPTFLPMYKIIYMNELDVESRIAFLKVFNHSPIK